MKKFCNCGNQLELSQRLCSECKAVNPFFIPAFSILSDQSESLEKLRIEKERIEQELQTKEKAQKEFERQEKLQNEIAELERQQAERVEAEKVLREKAEQERQAELQKELERQKVVQNEIEEIEKEKAMHMEAEKAMRERAEKEREEIEALEQQKIIRIELEKTMREKAGQEQIEKTREKLERQKQLQKEIDALETQKAACIEKAMLESSKQDEAESINTITAVDETEQSKTGHLNLFLEAKREVREELERIEEENKRLKQELEILTKQIAEKNEAVVSPVITEYSPTVVEPTEELIPGEPKQSNLVQKAVLGVVVLLAGFLVYFYFTIISNKQAALLNEPVETEAETAPATQVVDTVLDGDISSAQTDSTVSVPMEVSNAAFTPSTTNGNTSAETPVEKPKAEAKISVKKVTADLIGKTISGCGVTIGSDAKLDNVSGLVLVDKSANYAKYKCTIKIVQGGDTYTSVPYLYYSDEGTLIKIDGTNCE